MIDHAKTTCEPQKPSEFSAAEVGAEAALDDKSLVVPANLVSDDELVLLVLRPSMWFIVLGSLIALIIIGLITFLLAYIARLPLVDWSDTYAFAFGIGATSIRLGWQTLEWYSRLYVLTDRRVIRRQGVLRPQVFEAPLREIRHTTILASARERAFNLGSIGFATTGSDVFDAFWVMIRQPADVHRVVVNAIRRYRK